MKRTYGLFSAVFALLLATVAHAQNAGTVTNHAFAIGKGPGVTGYASLLCGSAQLAVGQAAANPICQSVSGDAALSAGGALTLATVNANVGSFGSATQCTAFTTDAKGRITAASAVTCTPAIGSVTGLGTGIATWLGTPSSANLRAAVTDETGTGLLYFQNGDIGTPSAGVGTNLTSLNASNLASGTTVVARGGTGQNTLTANAFLTGNGTTAINQVAITGLVLGNGASAPSAYAGSTACTNQFMTALSSLGVATCTTDTLASAQHANQGTTTTVLHGNAAGNPSFGAVGLTTDVTGVLPIANGGTNSTGGAVVKVNIQTFAASGTYTPSAGLLYSLVEMVGPGGGGGGANSGSATQIYGGGGGASGGHSRCLFAAATVGVSKAIVIGTGGPGGAAGSNNGSAGSAASTFGSTLCVANAGSGGLFSSIAQTPTGGDAGTAGSCASAQGACLLNAGVPGFFGGYSTGNATFVPSGNGGPGLWGGNGKGVMATAGAAVAGVAATGCGSGGSGGSVNSLVGTAAGGNGSAGCAIITEFLNQ